MDLTWDHIEEDRKKGGRTGEEKGFLLHSDFTFYRRVSATLGLLKLRGKGTDFYLLFLDKNVFNGLSLLSVERYNSLNYNQFFELQPCSSCLEKSGLPVSVLEV
jgi:hypothetical protein